MMTTLNLTNCEWMGGKTVKLRQIIKELNQAMREQREWLGL